MIHTSVLYSERLDSYGITASHCTREDADNADQLSLSLWLSPSQLRHLEEQIKQAKTERNGCFLSLPRTNSELRANNGT